MKHLVYTYTGDDIVLEDYINRYNSILGAYTNDALSFINYKGDSDRTNGDRMSDMYYKCAGDDTETIIGPRSILKQNTTLYIDNDKIRKEFLTLENRNLFSKQTDQLAFMSRQMMDLLSDPLYLPIEAVETRSGDVPTLAPSLSVFIYSRAIDKLLDVSPIIKNLTINSIKLSSSFNMGIAPMDNFDHLIDDKLLFASLYDSQGVRHRYDFMQLFTANDVVFVKFEKLRNETNREEFDSPHVVDPLQLPDQIYDFIGLIDSVNINSAAQGTSVDVSIAGRDLSKMLIDDNAYFIPFMFAQDTAQSLFINKQEDDRLIKRIFLDGSYKDLFAYGYKTIPESLTFIINQLGKLGILPKDSTLLDGYGATERGDVRTKAYKNSTNGGVELKKLDGLWQIIDLTIDESVKNRSLIDSTLSMPDGSLMSLFRKICQEPLVEFMTDTYGDKFHLIVRQPPFTKAAIRGWLNGTISTKEADIINSQHAQDSTYAYGELETPAPQGPFRRDNLKDVNNSPIITIHDANVYDDSFSFASDQAYSWYKYIPKQSTFSGGHAAIEEMPIVFFPEFAEIWGVKKMEVQSQYLPYQTLYGDKGEVEFGLFIDTVVNDLAFLIETNAYLPFTRRGTVTMVGDRRIKKGTWIRYEGTGEIFYVDSVTNSIAINKGSITRTTRLQLSRGMIEKFVNDVEPEPINDISMIAKPDHSFSSYSDEVVLEEFEGASSKEKQNKLSYFNIVNTDLIKVLIKKALAGGSADIKIPPNTTSNSGVNKDVFDFFLKRKQFISHGRNKD